MSKACIKRGDVFYADLSPVKGCEQKGVRPVLIIQNDKGNKESPTTIIAPISGKNDRTHLPTHVAISEDRCALTRNSVILLEQIRTIDKKRLLNKICVLDDEIIKKVDQAIIISLGLDEK